MLKLARSLAAVVLGYAAMVILITLVQEVWLGGVDFYASPKGELVLAAILSIAGAAVGGFVAAAVAGRSYRVHGLIMGMLVVVETIALTLTGGFSAPWWFNALSGAALIAGILVGAELFGVLRERRARSID